MNRKQRRAQQTSSSTQPLESADQIPLRVPDRTPKSNHNGNSKEPRTKTLYEIAAEKQAELLPQAERLNASRTLPSKPDSSNLVTVKVGPDGTIVHDDENNTPFDVEQFKKQKKTKRQTSKHAEGSSRQGDSVEDENNEVDDDEVEEDTDSDTIPPVLDSLLLSISLGAIQATLAFLAMYQYAEEVNVASIAANTIFVAIPTLFLLVHLFHGHVFAVPWLDQHQRTKYVLQQVFFVGVANAAGCYLIQLTNDRGYYAVMKNAPSIGTLWVWSVIELGLAGSLAGVIGPGFYAWWYNYGVF